MSDTPRWMGFGAASPPSGDESPRHIKPVGISIAGLRQDLLERFDDHIGVDAGGNVRVGIGPGLCGAQGVELGDDQAAGETRCARMA